MNIIFVDFDGVLDTHYYKTYEQMEEKIKILADICHTYNAKVVIEASAKSAIDEETMEIDEDATWVRFMIETMKKYGIEVYGRTPNVRKYDEHYHNSYTSMWKEYEIRLYLMRHPEIEHYCIIDDDDLASMHRRSDLDMVRSHLVSTKDYLDNNKEDEGLQEYHKEEVGNILQKDNDIKRLLRKYKNIE